MSLRRPWLIPGAVCFLTSCQSTEPADCTAPNRSVDGVCRRTCNQATDCLLGEACEAGVCLSTNLPLALDLTLTPNAVPAGGDVQIGYVTAYADEVKLRKISGGNTVELLLETSDAESEFTLRDIRQPLVIQLIARNDQGSDNLAVGLTVEGSGPTIESFVATPPTVQPGGQSTLSWQVIGATRIEIREGNRQPALFQSNAPAGTTPVTPAQNTRYWLYAFNEQVAVTQTVDVTILDGQEPAVINANLVAPTNPLPGDVGMLSWQTANANVVVLRTQGREAMRIDVPERVGTGSALVPVGETSVEWDVIAWNADVASPPRIAGKLAPQFGIALEELRITPPTFPPSDARIEVEAEWTLTGDPSRVEVTDPSGASIIYSENQSRHRTSVEAIEPATFRIKATGARGLSATHEITAWPIRTESSEHDQRDTAEPIDGFAIDGTLEPSAAPMVEDWYRLSVRPRDTLRVRVVPHEPCPASLVVNIYDGSNPDPEDTLPLPSPAGIRSLYAPALTAVRDSYVQLAVPSSDLETRTCAYTMFAEPFIPLCGNGMIDFAESCDQGDTTPRDGCSPTCTEEALDAYDASVETDGTPFAALVQRLPLWRIRNNARPPADDGIAVVELPFDFPFYGRLHRAFLVSTNGFIKLSPGEALNEVDEVDNLIAVLAANLEFDAADENAGIFVNTTHQPEPRVEISFRQMRNRAAAAGSGRASGSIVLFGSGRIELSYPNTVPPNFGPLIVGIRGHRTETAYGHPNCSPGIACTDPTALSQTRVTFVRAAIDR